MTDFNAWNQKIIDEFRTNGGKVGGQFEGAPILLLHSKGAKTGQERTTPMMYLAEGDRLVVFAVKGWRSYEPGLVPQPGRASAGER